jgi:chromosome segregation ATPase
MPAFAVTMLRHWKLVVIGLLVIAFAVMLAVKNGQIASRDRAIDRSKVEIANLQRDLGQCRSNVSTLQQGIEAQNRAVEAQRAASASRIAGLEQTLTTARRSAQTAQQQAAAILARRPGADQCADALALIRGG